MKKLPDCKAIPLDMIVPTHLKVEQLIDKEMREWNVDIVRDIFTTEDALIITNIHISRQQIPNKLIWRESESSEFTAKSTYVKARRVLGKEINHVLNRKKVWRIIWRAAISPKIKYFAWRLIVGFLPVCSQLISKGILINNTCSV